MQVRIVRMDDFGRGICYVNDKITFVPNSLIDDLLDIEISKETKKYNIGKIKEVITTQGQESPCPYSNECGGCSLLKMNYTNTLSFKKIIQFSSFIKSVYSLIASSLLKFVFIIILP